MPLTDEERERLRLTIAGMANAAWHKYPKASAGDLVDLWRLAVTEADKRRRARPQRKGRPKARTSETAQDELARARPRPQEEHGF